MRVARVIFRGLIYVFAAIGFSFVSMFFAIRFHITDVSGTVDARSSEFEKINDASSQVLGVSETQQSTGDSFADKSLESEVARLTNIQKTQQNNMCSLLVLQKSVPKDVAAIAHIQDQPNTSIVVSKMIFALTTALGNPSSLQNDVDTCLQNKQYAGVKNDAFSITSDDASIQSAFAWSRDVEWQSIAQAVVKDQDAITRASQAADIEPRLLVSSLIVEQIRLFHSQRELFKKFFEPLKILGNSTVISLGVMGIKPPTAEAVEQHLKDKTSPYYLGEKYEHMLDYPNDIDLNKERFARLTDADTQYWSYLYGALYLKQIMKQWSDAGYDISYRPEIVGTLFNVGFPKSHPNAHPQVGGSTIKVSDSVEYSFGRLAYEFYYSGELLDTFSYTVK